MRGANIAELAIEMTCALMKGSRDRVRSMALASVVALVHSASASAATSGSERRRALVSVEMASA